MTIPQITILPTPPSRQRPADFSDEGDAFLGALPQMQQETNEAIEWINDQTLTCTNSAAEAQAAADTATATANASMWVSGTTYQIGQVAISGVNFRTYRRTTDGGGTLDPANDPTNWALVTGGYVTTDNQAQTIGGDKQFLKPILSYGGGGHNTNFAAGLNALSSNVVNAGNGTGVNNLAVGSEALKSLSASLSFFGSAQSNTAVGYRAGYFLASTSNGNAMQNTLAGAMCGYGLTNGYNNTINGYQAGYGLTNGYNNTINGYQAGYSLTIGFNNTLNGSRAGYNLAAVANNTVVGANALSSGGSENVVLGVNAAVGVSSIKNYNVIIGNGSLRDAVHYGSGVVTGADYNVVIGDKAGLSLQHSSYSVLIGADCSSGTTSRRESCVAVGNTAMSLMMNLSNAIALGYGAQVTGSNQAQIGNSNVTTYVYGTVQNRSDARDKTEIRDTQLGLNFIEKLRPVDYKWDMREDYLEPMPEMPTQPEAPIEPIKPYFIEGEEVSESDLTDAQKKDVEQYNDLVLKYNTDKEKYEKEHEIWEAECERLRNEWTAKNSMSNIQRDGSKVRNRYHHGLIAQEVKSVMDELGIDFGGYQDHKLQGGEDVLSIGYDELIPSLIKSVQQLSARIRILENGGA